MHPGLRLQQQAKPLSDDRVVVGEYDGDVLVVHVVKHAAGAPGRSVVRRNRRRKFHRFRRTCSVGEASPGGRLVSTAERRSTMSEILVGIDGSAGAQDALAFATRVAQATGARFGSSRSFRTATCRVAARSRRTASTCAATRSSAGPRGGRRRRVTTATEAIAHTSPPHALHDPQPSGSAPRSWWSARHGAVRSGRVVPGGAGRAAPARLAVPGGDRAARVRAGRSDRDDRGRLRRQRRVRGRARRRL